MEFITLLSHAFIHFRQIKRNVKQKTAFLKHNLRSESIILFPNFFLLLEAGFGCPHCIKTSETRVMKADPNLRKALICSNLFKILFSHTVAHRRSLMLITVITSL